MGLKAKWGQFLLESWIRRLLLSLPKIHLAFLRSCCDAGVKLQGPSPVVLATSANPPSHATNGNKVFYRLSSPLRKQHAAFGATLDIGCAV